LRKIGFLERFTPDQEARSARSSVWTNHINYDLSGAFKSELTFFVNNNGQPARAQTILDIQYITHTDIYCLRRTNIAFLRAMLFYMTFVLATQIIQKICTNHANNIRHRHTGI
jgi:hypothetical protein